MFFFPYKLEIPYRERLKLTGTPFFTIIFGVMCFLIYTLQTYSDHQYKKRVIDYCKHDLSNEVRPIFQKAGSQGVFNDCTSFIVEWDLNTDHKNLEYFSYKAQLSRYEQDTLISELKRFNDIVAHDPLTTELWHDPLNSDISQYITSSFLHGDWEHLLFNLLFFFAFSMAIEQLMGSLIYLTFFLFCCLTTGIAYESNIFGAYGNLPTLGLSGVVMGVMTLTACVYPLKKMTVIFWFLILVTKKRVPVILLTSFYILTDIYGVAFLMEKDDINYIAHLAGAASGVIFAVLYFVFRYIRRKSEISSELEDGEKCLTNASTLSTTAWWRTSATALASASTSARNAGVTLQDKL